MIGFRRIRETKSGGAKEAEDKIGFLEGKIEIEQEVGDSITKLFNQLYGALSFFRVRILNFNIQGFF